MEAKKNKRSYAMNFAAFICFVLALALIVLLRLFQSESIVRWYNRYTDTLNSYDIWIQQNGATFLTAVIILVNYALKAVIPWVPLSFIMVIAGAVFPWYEAAIINVLGTALLFSIKYFWGKHLGGGNAEKILSKYDKAHTFIDKGKLGSGAVLFAARLIPCVPVNSVSQLYGTTDIPFERYLLVSLAGFSYKLFSYTVIGRNVYDPMSAKFIIPFVLLFLFSGITLLALNGVINVTSLTINKAFKHKKIEKG